MDEGLLTRSLTSQAGKSEGSLPVLLPISLYGACLDFDARLSQGLEACQGESLAEVRLDEAQPGGALQWFHQWTTPDGKVWLRAAQNSAGDYVLRFEDSRFRVSAGGKQVLLQAQPGALAGARHDLINTVVPMLLNLQGREILHASGVLSPRGEAVAFVGNGGTGKSTAAAAMMAAGYQLLSDDALPLLPHHGGIATASGAPEMNLWAQPRRLLGLDQPGLAEGKCLVRLGKTRHRSGQFRLARVYVVEPSPGAAASSLSALTAAQAVMELVRAAHRMDLRDRAMLERQFRVLWRVAESVLARRLVYRAHNPEPAAWAELVEADLRGPGPGVPKRPARESES